MAQSSNHRTAKLAALAVVAVLVSACAAGRAFRRGEEAAHAGDWDAAVTYYTRAVQADPGRAEYKITLERAMQNASHIHMMRARDFEVKDQLDAALLEYKRAAEYFPANRLGAAKVNELEQKIRDRIEATRPKPPVTAMRERARQATAEPILNPASREPLNIRFVNASLRDILNTIASTTGINITYDPGFQDRSYTVQLDGVTLEQALTQILTANTLFYKVLNERTIMIVPDNPTNRAKYEEQVIRTFYISHADATELAQLLNSVIRLPTMAVQPFFAPNKSANSITVRATAPVVQIIERIIEANDKPRAEVVFDVEILEVSRTRARQFGLNLTSYALGGVFSPEKAPEGAVVPEGVGSPPIFNLNTISQGISTADFYLAVPAAFVRFLEADSRTKLIAKPQLRGAEGNKITLNLGDEIPVPSTAFTPIAGGGANINPLTSFTYRPIGVNVEMTPRVTIEGEIMVELFIESSTLGRDVNVAGTNVPSFGSRKVTTRLRLRDGESNLLAGLLREDERRSARGFPGLISVPVLRQLFAANDDAIAQTDIVMLLTPHIVRTQGFTDRDFQPIYIGTQSNLGLGGPPPLIAQPEAGPAPPPGEPPPAAPPAALPAPGFPPVVPPPGVPRPPAAAAPGVPGVTPTPVTPGAPVLPPGTTPLPGTTAAPPPPAPAPTPPAAAPPGAPPTPATPTTPAPPTPAPTTPPVAPTPPVAGAPAIVSVTTPGPEFRVAAGPYTVPITISNAQRLTSITVTVTYNQAALRVRTVQEGSFMRQGGLNVAFTQRVDANTGRIDITAARNGDTTGATGSGLLAAILFDATAPGNVTFTLSGVATAVGGAQVPLQFQPATVVVK